MIFKKENRVKLVTFLRTLKSNKVVDDIDNYWKLIGENATIIDVGTNDYFNGKVLLLFDKTHSLSVYNFSWPVVSLGLSIP